MYPRRVNRLLPALILVIVGCAESETGIRLHIDSNLEIPRQLAQLHIRITPSGSTAVVDGGPGHESRPLLRGEGGGPADGLRLPITLGIKPFGGNLDHEVAILVEGIPGAAVGDLEIRGYDRAEPFERGEVRDIFVRLDLPVPDGGIIGRPDGGSARDGGSLPPCIGSACFVEVRTGGRHGCARRENGRVFCWGDNSSGQLGIGHREPASRGGEVIGLDNAIAVSLGRHHGCAVRSTGAAACWGENGDGQLGTGDEDDRSEATDVLDLAGVARIATGWDHSCAINVEGKLFCWGDNGFGQSGQPDRSAAVLRPSPVPIPSGALATDVAAGFGFGCVRTTDSDVYCWGRSDGLGTGATGNTHELQRVILSGPATTIAAGGSSACVVLASGSARCWGGNYHGQIGDGTLTNRSTPVAVSGLEAAAAVSVGHEHACALTLDGATLCWGRNNNGQIGDGSTADRTVPVPIVGLPSQVAVAAGGDYDASHSCGVEALGVVRCWGHRTFGQLGDDFEERQPAPTMVAGLSGMTGVSVGLHHACAYGPTGLWCWGVNAWGQLGNNETEDSGHPVAVALTSPVGDLDLGPGHGCVVLTEGQTYCWGQGGSGRLGTGDAHGSVVPVPVATDVLMQEVAAGETHGCALSRTHDPYCWGYNHRGQLGDGSNDAQFAPVRVGVNDVAEIVTGDDHTCARTANDVWCWGSNWYGELGDGTNEHSNVPVTVTGIGQTLALAAGTTFSCAVARDGRPSCWGRNHNGQLGVAGPSSIATPSMVPGLSDSMTTITAGRAHACAAALPGPVWCWGTNLHGQTGQSAFDDRSAPARVPIIEDATDLSAGGDQTCVVRDGGTVWCWGRNVAGALGNEDSPIRSTPTEAAIVR